MQGTLLLIQSHQHGRQRRTGMITYNGANHFPCYIKTTSMIHSCWILTFFILSTSTLITARDQYNGDVTPEDYVIDQLAALLQQHHLRQQQQQQQQQQEVEELTDDGLLYNPLGFSYQFPPLVGGRESQHEPYFAVNPSDPRYYLPSQNLQSDDISSSDDYLLLGEPASWTEKRRQQEERALQGPNPGEDVSVESRGTGRVVLPNPPAASEEIEIEEPLTTVRPPKLKPNNMILHVGRRPTFEPPHEKDHGAPLPAEKQLQRVIQEPVPPMDDIYFAAIVAGCSAAGVVTVIAAGICWYKLQRNAKAAADVEYPAYGVTGPNKDPSPTSGDRRLAQSAHMYHYQHQKQKILAMESRAENDRRASLSEAESDEENEEGDYTVYECPGLAPTGEMEVKNPLFLDDPTPATPATPRSDDRSTESGKKSPASGSGSTK